MSAPRIGCDRRHTAGGVWVVLLIAGIVLGVFLGRLSAPRAPAIDPEQVRLLTRLAQTNNDNTQVLAEAFGALAVDYDAVAVRLEHIDDRCVLVPASEGLGVIKLARQP